VTTRNGALPETCGDWADYSDLDNFSDALNHAIDNYQYNNFQVESYNKEYGWDTRAKEWETFLESYKGFVPRLEKLKASGVHIDRLLDIGAYRGEFSKAVDKVWGYVPTQQIEADERQREFIPSATFALLGDANKEVDFYTLADGITTGSSIYRENTDYYKDPLIIKKQMVTLDSLVDFNADWSNGLVKIDVQGAELDVLRGGHKFLTEKKPRYILLECSIQQYNIGAPLVDEVIKQMKDWGYQPRAEFDLVYDANGEPLQVDLLFERNTMRRVLIATPAYDGRLDVWYTNSLVNTIRIAQERGIFIHPVYLSYDALIQRARNDLMRLAVEENYDDMIWVDSDLEWEPEWIMELLNRPEDVVGGTYRKKTDDEEMYTVKTRNLVSAANGLVKVEGIGTGFLKVSRKALLAVWEDAPRYMNEGRESRMVCDVQIIDGQLVSEDNILCEKLRQKGFDLWLDPKMTCAHIGPKKFKGNMQAYLDRMKAKSSLTLTLPKA
jgi:FkbM family methyltransferase